MRGIEASWLFRGDVEHAATPDGAVVVDDAGTIVEVGGAQATRETWPDITWERHEGVLLPGLVNACVSLSLSGLRGSLAPTRGLVSFLRALSKARGGRAPSADHEAIARAVRELVRGGTAAVGEVTETVAAEGLAVVRALGEAPLRARIFHEVRGLRRETALVMQAMNRQEAVDVAWPDNTLYLESPHSLIGLHPELVSAVSRGELPTPMRLAWSRDERAFLADGGGAFGRMLVTSGSDPCDWPPPGLDPVAHAEALGALGPSRIATHLTDLRGAEAEVLARTGTRVVLCPRSSLHVEGKLPPLPDMRRAGLRPGLGTDSLAVADSVDVLDEARALRDGYPDVPTIELLAMATSWGARALGLDDDVGTLAPGLSPGVLLFEGEAVSCGRADPLDWVLRQMDPARRRLLVRPGRGLGPA